MSTTAKKSSSPKAKRTTKKVTKPKVKSAPKSDPESEPKPDPAPAPESTPEQVTAPTPEPKPESTVTGPGGVFGVPSKAELLNKGEPDCRIKNLRNRRVDITLEHEVYCSAIGRCVCSNRKVVRDRPIERKSKAMAPRIESIRIPKSIILAPLGVSEPLHEAVKNCADVRSKLVTRPQKLKILPV